MRNSSGRVLFGTVRLVSDDTPSHPDVK
jgi:hypothetical protein